MSIYRTMPRCKLATSITERYDKPMEVKILDKLRPQ